MLDAIRWTLDFVRWTRCWTLDPGFFLDFSPFLSERRPYILGRLRSTISLSGCYLIPISAAAISFIEFKLQKGISYRKDTFPEVTSYIAPTTSISSASIISCRTGLSFLSFAMVR